MSDDPLFSLKGRTALVTGGTGDIGRAIAEMFLERGARVYVCSRRADACEATASELSVKGDCRALVGDPGSVEGTRAIAAALAERETSLDIVIHNAGTSIYAPFESFSEADWDQVFDVNLKGIFFLTQALLPLMQAAATPGSMARVINIGSASGVQASPSDAYSYSISKAALNHMTRKLARRLAKDNITVNTISPGPVEAGMMLTVVDEAFRTRVRSEVPLGRMATAEEIAAAALFLASPAGAFVNAAVLPVDGGITGCMG